MTSLGSCLILVILPLAQVEKDTNRDTLAYVHQLQTPRGGFVASLSMAKSGEPTLRATSAALRSLHYLGGRLNHAEACEAFVVSCFDSANGAFRDTPTGKPDVNATSIGLMALVELNLPREKYVPKAVAFLAENASSFEEIRLAAGALETINSPCPCTEAWLRVITKDRRPDGTYGSPRATASAAVAELRLTGKLEAKEAVLRELRQGQHDDGAWGDEQSNLETTYRILRCFKMLNQKPSSLEKLTVYLDRCRNADGGYGVTPDSASTIAGTYYVAIIRQWIHELKRLP